MTDTQEQTLPAAGSASTSDAPAANGASGAVATRPAAKGLSSKLLPELQQIAGGLGISTTKKKKADLVAAIQAARSGSGSASSDAPSSGAPTTRAPRATAARNQARQTETPRTETPRTETPRSDASRTVDAAPASNGTAPATEGVEPTRRERPRRERALRSGGEAETRQDSAPRQESAPRQDSAQRRESAPRQESGPRSEVTSSESRADSTNDTQQGDRQNGSGRQQGDRQQNDRQRSQNNGGSGQHNAGQNNGGQNNGTQNNGSQNNGTQNRNDQNRDDDDDFDGRGRRGRRYRDRRGRTRDRQPGGNVGGGQTNTDVEPTVYDDDVLVPVGGVLDCVEDGKGNWYIRVEGYFASSEDVFVANSFVRKFNLRRGDAVTGTVRQSKDGERREKYNPLVRLDTVNGRDPESIKNRVEFTKLTPLYPQERLRLETEPHILTTRVIDLVMPIGKGQRALIVSPPKAGKTMVLQAIANAIVVNNPEAHLMVVLVDERPEEVTDMQRSVKGEVIASTFDRRPQDHIAVAELSIERAKRLVEMGHDVVVLLDSITRLGRAYNLGAPASGRILSGGVDSQALYQPKRFLGAARNIENGGSLTIIATALVETGSAGDTVFFEEYKGTGNAELKLDRKIADKRIFPAIDVDQSSTRKEELLLSPDELAVTIKLRRVLHSLEQQQAIELLLDRLRKTRTNIEFLMQIAKTTPGGE